jgi:IclR family KDG regulon transcriptional repressor
MFSVYGCERKQWLFKRSDLPMNRTAEKVVSVLKLLANFPDGMTITEISRVLCLPKSSVFDIVYTLKQNGFLEADSKHQHKYRLGLEAFNVGYSYLKNLDICEVSRPILSKLRDETGDTVFLAVRNGTSHITYVMKLISDSPLQTTSVVGSVSDLLKTGLGKAILAAMSDEEALSCVTDEMIENCNNPLIHDRDSLLEYLKDTRRCGYAKDRGKDISVLISSVAAPIMNSENKVVAATSNVTFLESMSKERQAMLGEKINAAAFEISKRLGYLGESLFIYD